MPSRTPARTRGLRTRTTRTRTRTRIRTSRTDAPRTHATRTRAIRSLLLAVALLTGGVAVSLAAPPAPAGALPDFASEMLTKVNDYRAANGVGPVIACDNLSKSAQGHAADMAARNYFSHYSPEGTDPVARDLAAGYTTYFTAVGENIAKGFSTVTTVMQGWAISPGHRANMVDPAFTHLGMGLAESSSGVKYWVQEFGAGGNCGAPFAYNLDTMASPWPQTVRATGWAIEKINASTSLSVDVYVDGAGIGRFPANLTRNDVAAAFPGAGPAHGFDVRFNASPGTHEVCFYAIGLGRTELISCRTIGLASASPLGSLDGLDSPAPGLLHLRGWTFDPETVNPLALHVYLDGSFGGAIDANRFRSDIANYFPSYGGNHGFDTNLAVTASGVRNVCVYAINQYLGDNTLLGCRMVSITDANPQGSLDGVDLTGPRRVTARGWALDADTTAPINVDLYVDGAPSGRFAAATYRQDVATSYPALGGNHGFSAGLTLAPGTHSVCAYGINAGTYGTNKLLGCKSVSVPSSPQGAVDTATRTGTTISGKGWAVDPDTSAPITVHVYVDGLFKGAYAANQTRNDIASAYPFFGATHGFSFSVTSTNAPHTVCVYGINAGLGTNALLGCRSV